MWKVAVLKLPHDGEGRKTGTGIWYCMHGESVGINSDQPNLEPNQPIGVFLHGLQCDCLSSPLSKKKCM